MIRPIAAIGALISVAVPATAQMAGSRATREFVEAAGESDAFEIAEAESALAQSSDPQVLAFARRMLADHRATSLALQEAASQSRLPPPPTQIGAAQAPFLAALQSARGRDFDQLYWRQQLLAHHAALVTASRYATDGDTLKIRQAARAIASLVQLHLDMIEKFVQNMPQ